MFWLLRWQRASTMRMKSACTLTVTDLSSRACSLLRSLLSKAKDPSRFQDMPSPLCRPTCSSTLLAICTGGADKSIPCKAQRESKENSNTTCRPLRTVL